LKVSTLLQHLSDFPPAGAESARRFNSPTKSGTISSI
jgi:hypothetical protein